MVLPHLRHWALAPLEFQRITILTGQPCTHHTKNAKLHGSAGPSSGAPAKAPPRRALAHSQEAAYLYNHCLMPWACQSARQHKSGPLPSAQSSPHTRPGDGADPQAHGQLNIDTCRSTAATAWAPYAVLTMPNPNPTLTLAVLLHSFRLLWQSARTAHRARAPTAERPSPAACCRGLTT